MFRGCSWRTASAKSLSKKIPTRSSAFLKGVAEGVARTRNDPADGQARDREISPRPKTAKIVDDTYDFYAPYFVTHLALKPEQLTTWFGYLDEKEYPQVGKASAKDFYDNSFVEALEKSGFLSKARAIQVEDILRTSRGIHVKILDLCRYDYLSVDGCEDRRAQERVRVGWAAMTASHTPLWVAQDRGFLAKQGLAVESIFFGAGPPAMQALVAGDLDIVVTSAPNVVNPRLGGVDAVMILSIIPTFIDHIVSAANITTTEQLRGKIGSVNRFGSISEMGLRLSLRRLGHRSRKGREDRARGRESRAVRVYF